MATRTISNAGGNWNATTAWVEAAVPVAGDDIVATGTSGNLVVNVATANLNSFNLTSYVGTLSGSSGINVTPTAGTVTVLFAGTITWTGALLIRPTSPATINFTSGGNTLLVNDNVASWTGVIAQQDDLTLGSYSNSGMTLSGTWNTNSHNITLSGATRSIINNTGTFTAGTGTVTFSTPNAGIIGTADMNFYKLVVNGTSVRGTTWLKLQSSQTVTNSITLAGFNATSARLLVWSINVGTQVVLNVPNTSAAGYSNVDFQDIDLHSTAGGRIDLTAITGLAGDCGGNNATDMKFLAGQTDIMVFVAGVDWSSQAWSLNRAPLPQDNVQVSGTISGVLNTDMCRLGSTIDFSAWATSGSPSFGTDFSGSPDTSMAFYGNFTGHPSFSIPSGSVSPILRNGSFTLANFVMLPANLYNFNLINSNLTLITNTTFGQKGSTGFVLDANSTFNDNGFNVTCGQLLVSGGKTWTMTGVWTINRANSGGNVWSNTATTMTATASTIILSDTSATGKTFAGGGKSFGNLVITGTGTGTYTITGANTFADFRDSNTSAHTITFPGSATTTCTSFHVKGLDGTHLITLAASSGTFTLSIGSGTIACDFLSISNSTATGGASFFAGAGSTNGGGNTGWTFSAAPNATAYTMVSQLSSGFYNSATTFYVDLNGPAAGTVDITPVTTGSGTFSPNSLTWTVGQSQTQTFTYTPSTIAGSPHTISVTNDASLTNPASISYTVMKLPLVIYPAVASKRADGTVTAFTFGGSAALPIIAVGSLQGSDTANFTQVYASSAVGTQIALTPSGTVNDGNSGNNYSYTFVTQNIGIILPVTTEPVLPTLSWIQLSDWKNVKTDFGAVGDGVTDDTTAIANAITNMLKSGSVFKTINTALYFPPGTYLISSTLNVIGDTASQKSFGIHLVGCGASTVIKWAGAANGTMLEFNNSGYAITEGITFDGGATAGIGFDINSPNFQTALTIRHCEFRNIQGSPGVGFYSRGSSQNAADSTIFNCKFKNNVIGATFFQFNTLDWTVDHCWFAGHSSEAIDVVNGQIYLRNSHFERNLLDVSLLHSVSGNTIRTCTSRGSGRLLDSPGSQPNVLEDCWIDSWGYYPAIINGTSDTMLAFDLTFTLPPNSGPPVVQTATSAKIMYSNFISAATSAVISTTAGSSFLVPVGAQSGTVTGPDQASLQTNISVPSTVLDAVRDYGADKTGVTDATTAIQNCINAAIHAGSGALAYIPYGTYKITSALHLTGSSYSAKGAGFQTQFNWAGAAGGNVVFLDAITNVTFSDVKFSGATRSHNIYASGLSTWIIDEIYTTNSSVGDVYLDTLPSGSVACIRHCSSNVFIHDCGSAKVLYKFSVGALTVDGTSAATLGNIGVLVHDMGNVPLGSNVWLVNDGQSIVASEYYMESIPVNDNGISSSGGKSNTLITLGGTKANGIVNPWTYINIANATSFTPQISLMGMNITESSGITANLTLNNSGTGAINFIIDVSQWSLGGGSSSINLTGTVNNHYAGNSGTGSPSDTTYDSTSQTLASAALDHFRLLRILDAGIQDPIIFTPPPAPPAYPSMAIAVF